MTKHRGKNSFWTRFVAILIGIALLFWLPFEETSETMAILFAFSISAWFVTVLLQRLKKQSLIPIIKFTFAGILNGIIITPLTLSLLVFKIGLHAHSIPDYTKEQIFSIIRRTPIWLISGFFIGVGLGIIINSLQIRQEPNHAIER